MTLSLSDWLVVALYFVVSAAIGLAYTRRASKSLADYFVSGRSLPWWLAGTSMVATTFAADTPLAVAGLVAKYGVAGNWLWWNGALSGMPSFTWRDATVAGVACTAGRTGYTGEDGFELACRNKDAATLWAALLDKATPLGGLPVGLGARDSLRLESKLPLYGNDLDEEHTPLEAGLGWAVKLDNSSGGVRDFIGASVLRQQKHDGIRRQLVGFTIP